MDSNEYSGNVRDKPRREKERSNLKVAFGENIVRLSLLEGIFKDLYKQVVLPRILEIISSNKDVISQQYLMDCIVQAISDEYHFHKLD